jgi:hypothetical protein
MREYAVRAYAEARRREREAKSKAEAQNWSRVALLVAERTCKRVGLDTVRIASARPSLRTRTRWTSWAASSRKTPDPDNSAFSFLEQEPVKGQRSWRRSR